MYLDLHVKYPLFLSDFKENSIILIDIRIILKYHVLWKSVQWTFRADRRRW